MLIAGTLIAFECHVPFTDHGSLNHQSQELRRSHPIQQNVDPPSTGYEG